MSEGIKVQVPIEIPQPQQQPAAEKPQWARKSLHSVRMPRQEVQLAPEWVNNGPNVELKWQPVEQRAEPEANTPPQYTQPYQQQGVNHMDDQQQQQGGAQPPDPMSYDFYDSNDVARFHQDNSAYYQQVVRGEVQAALQPHLGALNEAQLRQDYNAAVARYGEDANFQEVMDVALKNCEELAKSGKPFSIVEAYQNANDASAARPGKRGNAHLPESFRGKNGVGMLGRIIEHNHQTGRARPFGNRNWKG